MNPLRSARWRLGDGLIPALAFAFCISTGPFLVIDGTTGLIFAGTDFRVGDDLPHNGWNFAFEFNSWHHVLHIVTGAVLAIAALKRTWTATGALAFGLAYAALAPLAMIDGNDALDVVFSDTPDNLVHATLAAIGLLLGISAHAGPGYAARSQVSDTALMSSMHGAAARDGLVVARKTKALEIEDLVKRYPTGVEALHGVSLEIHAGEFFGLLGPNGAGKSTLIHCATGLAQPTSGSIQVFGHDAITAYGEARQAVGLAPQELNLDWFLTVEETLDYHAGYFGMPKRERRERAGELLETFSLEEKRKERTRTLSGGMKRRLILARALMHRPRLLILDEPTAGVDIELRLELWHYVQRINQEGTTILLTTHYLEEAEQLCDRIAFINQGQVIAHGSSAELAERYGVANLEDAYLALVGRAELSRSRVEGLAS